MENQSTNDNKIICRKCKGPHFTIKCGKEKKATEPIHNPIHEPNMDKKEFSKETREPNEFKNRHKQFERRPYFKTTYRVKISELPNDMTEEEMMELTCDWGHVVKVKVLCYHESATAYIDFGYEEEADYFIKAIDKTPFEYLLISAQRVDSFRPKTN